MRIQQKTTTTPITMDFMPATRTRISSSPKNVNIPMERSKSLRCFERSTMNHSSSPESSNDLPSRRILRAKRPRSGGEETKNNSTADSASSTPTERDPMPLATANNGEDADGDAVQCYVQSQVNDSGCEPRIASDFAALMAQQVAIGPNQDDEYYDEEDQYSYEGEVEDYDYEEVLDDHDEFDSPRCRMNHMSGFFHFMRQMTEEHEHNDEEDDDDDEPCDCPGCTIQRMEMEREGLEEVEEEQCDCSNCRALRAEASSDDDEDSDYFSNPDLQDQDGKIVAKATVSPTSNDYDTAVVDDDDYDEDQAASCSICFATATSKNPFVTLPCCGTQGTVATTSTMHFCQACIVKTIKTQEREELERFGPYFMFQSPQRKNDTLLGECPRCRMPICCTTNSKKKTTIVNSTFDQVMKYAANKQDMKTRLFLIAHVHHNVFPVELFQMDAERHIEKLAQWGILTRMQEGTMYQIDPEHQQTLLKFITSKEERPEFTNDEGMETQDEIEWQYRAYMDVVYEYVAGTAHAKDNKKWLLCINLIHCAIIMFWKAHRLLPHNTSCQLGKVRSSLIAALNAFLVCVLLLVLVVVGSVGGVAFGLLKGAGLALRISLEPNGPTRLGNMGLIPLGHLILMIKYSLGTWVLVKAACIHGIAVLLGWFLVKKYERVPADFVRVLVYVVHVWYLVRSTVVSGSAEEKGMGDISTPADVLQGFEL